MKLNNDLEKAFNDQITLEFQASMVYRQLAIEMEVRDLPGMASWLRHQADEEIVHANKFIDHLSDRDNHPVIGGIPAPDVTVDSVLDGFKVAYQHELRVSASIRDLVGQADKAGDYDSRPLLNWFLSEQIEEESTITEIIGRITMTGDDGPGLLRLDGELALRPTATTED